MLLIGSGSAAVRAGGPPEARDDLDAIKRDADKADARLDERFKAAGDEKAQKTAVAEYWKELAVCGRRAFSFSRNAKNPKEAAEAAIWVVHGMNNGYVDQLADVIEEAFALLADRWIDTETLAPLCYYTSGYCLSSPAARRFLAAAAEKSPHRLVRGVATLGPGSMSAIAFSCRSASATRLWART